MLSRSAVSALILAAAAIATTVQGMFRFDCFNNVVVDRVDPIVNFGTVGTHVHAVSGGNGFSMTATGKELRESTCTSCPIGADLSAYWVPQMYVKHKNGSGYSLVESHQIVYYQPRGEKDEAVIAFPEGLKMLAGDPKLRTESEAIEQRAVTWVCLDYKNPHPEQQGIPPYKCPHGLRGQVNFPMCWNGKDLDSPDHKSHIAYATGLDGGKCPDGWKKMVKIFYEAFYSVDKWDAEWDGDKHPFVLSNGDSTGFSFHGDFLNGWDVKVLQDAIDQCSDKNYFDSGECAPLKPTYSSKPPAQRCTLEPQVKEETAFVTKLPGVSEMAGDSDKSPAPAPATSTPGMTTPAATTAKPPASNEDGPATVAPADKTPTPSAAPVTTKPTTPTTTKATPSAGAGDSKCRVKRN